MDIDIDEIWKVLHVAESYCVDIRELGRIHLGEIAPSLDKFGHCDLTGYCTPNESFSEKIIAWGDWIWLYRGGSEAAQWVRLADNRIFFEGLQFADVSERGKARVRAAIRRMTTRKALKEACKPVRQREPEEEEVTFEDLLDMLRREHRERKERWKRESARLEEERARKKAEYDRQWRWFELSPGVWMREPREIVSDKQNH